MGNHYIHQKHCIKCNTLISDYAIKCPSCSTKEKIKLGIINNKGKNHPLYKNGLPRCVDCGKELSDYTSKRCIKCYKKYAVGKHAPSFKDGNTLKKHYCKDCKKELVNPNAKRCNHCHMMYRIKTGTHPFYIDGKSKKNPYTLEFSKSLKESIRNRDNYECQNCGMTEEEHLIVIGTNLIIHHIDYDKENCKEDNLITVCKQCNLRANRNRDYWKKLYQNKIKEIINVKNVR